MVNDLPRNFAQMKSDKHSGDDECLVEKNTCLLFT